MASVNKKVDFRTEENEVGTKVRAISADAQLARMTLAHMLWEDQFYVDGKTSVEVIQDLVSKVSADKVAALAVQARTDMKLRHVPLLLTRELARTGRLTANMLDAVIQRSDEMGEFLSLYWKEGKCSVSNQVKKGLAKAFVRFNEYQLAKGDKNSAGVSVRDVMFISHVKPEDEAQEALFKRIANKAMKTPDTWEVALSGGANKKETFERLMAEGKLGALAFLRNLRNMVNTGVPESIIRAYSKTVNVDKVLPFRYIAAARIVPQFEDMLENMMFRSLVNAPKLPGRTVLVVDTSGSMHFPVSNKSDLQRSDAAAALAMLAREICEEVVIYATAGNDHSRIHATMVVPPRRGFALADYINGREVQSKIGAGGIFTLQAMNYIAEKEIGKSVDRVIIFTDEQDCEVRGDPASAKTIGKHNYIMNVGSYQNGINSGRWENITGFSEAVLDYVRISEQVLN